MKQSAMVLIALAPLSCWAASAEEEALQQQLDLLRQQLIQQNQALHQLQARLEAVKTSKTAGTAAATGAVAGTAATASAPQNEATRRTPEAGRSTEDLMIEQHNVFDRAWVLDFGLSYQHYNRKDLALRGFLALDAIFLG